MNYEEQVRPLLAEFDNTIRSVAGVCFDAMEGFSLNVKEIEKHQREFIEKSDSKEPADVQMRHLDSAWILYGEGNPNDSGTILHHRSTQKDFKVRNSEGGNNLNFIGNMGLITIYHYWDELYRVRIGNICGVNKNEVQCDVFGDMRLIRNSILHNNGIAKEDVRKCKTLQWFKSGDSIVIDKAKFLELLRSLRSLRISVGKQTPITLK
ncbi:MAG: hypothetical protein ACKVRP_06380 [Bacteroidota bacterium]